MTYSIYDNLPEDIERRRLSAAEKASAPRSVDLWPIATDVIEAVPVAEDAALSGLPNRRQLRRGGTRLVRRMTRTRVRVGVPSSLRTAAGFQGNH